MAAKKQHRSIDRVGVDITLDREIVREIVTHKSWISCEWTDGIRACCEVWQHEGRYPISVRESLRKAAVEGWILVCGLPVCGCHTYDPGDNELADLESMEKYYSTRAESQGDRG